MSDSDPTEASPPPREEEDVPSRQERPRTAVGQLRPHPSAPTTTWTPPEADAPAPPRREVGDLEQRGAARRRDGLRRIQGTPSLQALGWILFILGGLIYLHAVWATANATLTGAAAPEQTISFAGAELLQGSVGLGIMVVGLLVALVFTFIPVYLAPPLVPGTLEYEVAATNLIRARTQRRITMWVGVSVFAIGLALAVYPLKESIVDGTLYTVSMGGNAYRVHYWGYLIAAVGIALTVPLAVTQGAIDRAAAVAEGALPSGKVRRARDAEEGSGEESVARPRWASPPAAPGPAPAPDRSGRPLEERRTATEREEARALEDETGDEADTDDDDGLLRPPRSP